MTRRRTVPLFGTGLQGKSPTISAQGHMNLRAEIRREDDKAKLVFYGTPGLDLFSSTLGDTPARGWIAVGSIFYVVHRGTFWEVNNAGVKTSRGTLNTTSGRVDLAYDGSVVLMVDGTNGYTYTVATTTFAEITDSDFPDGANTCAWMAGQFIVDAGNGSQIFYISPTGTSWDALDFASAESAPDGLVRVFVDNGELVLFGEDTTEFWGAVGGSDFPFSPIKGATQEFGLAARWSLTKFNSGLAALMKSTMGQVQVMFIRGYVPAPISSPDLDTLINAYATKADATFYSYMDGGHPILRVNFPAANKSWEIDAASGYMPTEVSSGLSGDRHRGEMHLDFLNRSLVSDYETGDIYVINPSTYTDNGTAIARELTGKHFFNSDNPIVVSELFVDMETGVGLASGQGSDPKAMLTTSVDGGRTWSNEAWARMGKIGEYLTRVAWRRLGAASDWVFRIRITDSVKVVITYAALRAR